MKQRVIATVILWLIVIILPLLLGKTGAFLIILAFGLGSQWELLDLLRRAGRPVDRIVALGGLALLLLLFMLVPPWVMPPFALVSITLSATLVASFISASRGTFTATAMPTLGSVFLIGVPLACGVLVVHESGVVLAVWLVAVAKFADVGGLLTGMWIGEHKMAPAYSPKKTWEGLGGGVVLSVVVSVVYVLLFHNWLPGLSPVHAAWMAVPISLAGVISDLMESAFKREAKAKDSGRLIPGIGGILDLTDSLLLAMPVGYFLIWLVL